MIGALVGRWRCRRTGHRLDPASAVTVGRVLRCRCGQLSYGRASQDDVRAAR